jgi:hypothetical protein
LETYQQQGCNEVNSCQGIQHSCHTFGSHCHSPIMHIPISYRNPEERSVSSQSAKKIYRGWTRQPSGRAALLGCTTRK